MGQSSQIYIRFKERDGSPRLIAQYYGWNYGERMISRARHGIEYILEVKAEYGCSATSFVNSEHPKIARIFDVNFDMQDVALSCDIIQEWKDYFSAYPFNDQVFRYQHNNGKLFVDVVGDTVKYAFLDGDCNLDHIMDGEAYMEWEAHGDDWHEDLRQYGAPYDNAICEDNIKWLREHATLMTREELEDFILCDYGYGDTTMDARMERLWEEFGAVPMNEDTEQIEEAFQDFPAGTHREDILHWFDEKHSKGVAFLLTGGHRKEK